MANSLDEEIEYGTIVVLKSKLYNITDRRFIAEGGFGMSNVTAGSAIYGVWVQDGSPDRIEGYEINASETRKYWSIIGSKSDKKLAISLAGAI